MTVCLLIVSLPPISAFLVLGSNLATSQPFLRRFESRASRRNALMRTWLPSHFPPSSSRDTPTALTTVAAVTVATFRLDRASQARNEGMEWRDKISLTRRSSGKFSFDLYDNEQEQIILIYIYILEVVPIILASIIHKACNCVYQLMKIISLFVRET